MVKNLPFTHLIGLLNIYNSYLGITLAVVLFFTLLVISIITLTQLFFSKNNKEISISKNEFLLTNMFKHQSQVRKSRAKSAVQLRSHKPTPTENYNHPANQ